MKKLSQPSSQDRARAGFSLLELIVVLAIMAIVAGAAVPLARRTIDRAARKATLTELDSLSHATLAFFEDTGHLPSRVGELLRDPGLTGWTGPYLTAVGKDLRTGRDSAELDGWSFEYRVERESDSVLLIESPGVGGLFGDEGDLGVRVDVTPVRRERTLDQLRTLNLAIESYNRAHLQSEPLPTDYGQLLSRLVSRGFLPGTEPWSTDGWGAPFMTWPPNATPVMRVVSRTMTN